MFARPSSEMSEDMSVNTNIHFILGGKANVTISIEELLCLSDKNQARQTSKYLLLGLLLLVLVTVN